MIIGNDVLIPLGIDCLASTKTIKWDGMNIPYKPSSHFTTPTSVVSTPNQDPSMLIPNQTEANFLSVDPDSELTEYIEERICHSYVAEIKESKYEIVPLSKVAKLQTHLSSSQQDQFFDVLKDFEPLFNGNLVRTGKLGTYKGPLATLELNDDAKPFHNRPYSVPKAHEAVFKKTLDEMVKWGILEVCGPKDYLSPTFIIPKKDGRVRFISDFISDFRQLNKIIKSKGAATDTRYPEEARRL